MLGKIVNIYLVPPQKAQEPCETLGGGTCTMIPVCDSLNLGRTGKTASIFKDVPNILQCLAAKMTFLRFNSELGPYQRLKQGE